jgi:hypothetical protein
VLAAAVNVAGPAEIARCKLVPDCPCVRAAPPARDTNRYRYPGRRPRRECHSHRLINITITGTALVPFTPIPATRASAAGSEGTPVDSNAGTVSNEVMPIRKMRWC